MLMVCTYLLKGKEVIRCNDPMEWGMTFERSNRIIVQTHIGTIFISTVFLGFDHSWGNFLNEDGKLGRDPIVFETMVFRGKFDQAQERYATYAEAEAGHKIMVDKVKKCPMLIHSFFDILKHFRR